MTTATNETAEQRQDVLDSGSTAAMTAEEAREAQAEEASNHVSEVMDTVTQREWLGISRALDMPRGAIVDDSSTYMVAAAWVTEKRAHGGASWDRILDMTDRQILELLGFPTDDE